MAEREDKPVPQYEDKATGQLPNYKKEQKKPPAIGRASDGIPYKSLTATLTCGPRGPPLLQDTECIGLLQNFARKNLRVRYVHAQGTGAHGYFQCTNPEIAKLSKANLFQNTGKKTPIFVRFGFSDNDLEPDNGRTFFWSQSIKIYTEDGNFDLLNINSPMFTFRDAFNFPNQHNAHFTPPMTSVGFRDPSAFWDYVVNRPELIHRTLINQSDLGLPFTLQTTTFFPINIFRFVDENGEYHYAKFEFSTNQGLKYLSPEQGSLYKKKDVDFAARNLYNAIEAGENPSWTWYVQIMDKDGPVKYQKKTGWSAFDLTKLWPHNMFPRIEIGQIVVNRNPENHFNETEQSAFNPGSLPPGVEAALEDKLFHGRIFAYHDAHMYRLGGNKSMIPINQPKGVQDFDSGGFKTYFKGCRMNYDPTNQGGQPIYAPNSFGGPTIDPNGVKTTGQYFENRLDYHDTSHDDNFGQARMLYENVMKEDERKRLAKNIAGSLSQAEEIIQKRTLDLFANVSSKLAQDIQKNIDEYKM